MPIQPMKAITIEAGDYCHPCYASEKYDGWRCMIVDGVMYTSGGNAFKPNVQARFKPIIDMARRNRMILDGELYCDGVLFSDIAGILSSSKEVMALYNLKFYCFDSIVMEEYNGKKPKQTFRHRGINYHKFAGRTDCQHVLFMPVRQKKCMCKADATAFYNEVKEHCGEGIMLRTIDGLYEPGMRSKGIAKWKVWHTAEAKVVAVARQACPVKYADEVIDGKGYRNVCGSVMVEILPDQPLAAYALQKATFTGSQSIALRRKFWQERESMVGKIVEIEYLPGGNSGRQARFFRVREDMSTELADRRPTP